MALNKFSRTALALMIMFALLALGLAVGTHFLAFQELDQSTAQISATPDGTPAELLDQVKEGISASQSRLWRLLMPILGGVLLVLALIFWGLLKASAGKAARELQTASGKRAQASPKQSPRADREDVGRDPTVDQRLFLHLVSVLQREGRLLDFLSEDLGPYEDSQIGAAVRPIHESCGRIIRKVLAPKPVLDSEEGDSITVEADFDPTTIKLTGNVTGDPPFRGVLRHSGWRAAKLELPSLSGSQSPQLIAPAEVELE